MIYRSPVAKEVYFDNTGQSLLSTTSQDAHVENRQLVGWDPEFVTTSSSGTTTLINTNKTLQIVSGTASGHSFLMPDATTLFNGRKYEIANTSSQPINIKNASGTSLVYLNPNSIADLTLKDNSTVAGIWIIVIVSTIASGIESYNLVSSTPFSTSSTTEVPITGFTLSPLSGTYAVWFNAHSSVSSSNKTLTFSIYKGGIVIADSTRSAISAASSNPFPLSTMTISQFTGSEAADVRVSISGSTLTIGPRSLLLIRLGV